MAKPREASNMSELVLPFAIMALTVLVLGGLLLCFRKWLALRDQLDRRAAEPKAVSWAPPPERRPAPGRKPAPARAA
jgi:hypothetical protein